MIRSQRTFCRICEAYCGLVVDLDGNQVTGVRPDRDHPVSRGFSCIKGLGVGALHDDPDRLNHPLKRGPDGLQRISWETTTVGPPWKRLPTRPSHDSPKRK